MIGLHIESTEYWKSIGFLDSIERNLVSPAGYSFLQVTSSAVVESIHTFTA